MGDSRWGAHMCPAKEGEVDGGGYPGMGDQPWGLLRIDDQDSPRDVAKRLRKGGMLRWVVLADNI